MLSTHLESYIRFFSLVDWTWTWTAGASALRADGSAAFLREVVEVDTSAGRAWGSAAACCCFLSSVVFLVFSTAREILVGHVGSRGECRSRNGVVEKRWGRLRVEFSAFIRLAHAVQLDVVLVFKGQESAWWLSEQYGNVTCTLQNFEV